MPTTTPNPDAPLVGWAASIDRAGETAIVWVTFSIATAFTLLRCTVRWCQNRRLAIDDYWILLAWTSLLPMSILVTVQTESLWYFEYSIAGRIAMSEQFIHQYTQVMRLQFASSILFLTVLWCIKGGFLALFWQLVKTITLFRRLWYGVVAFTTLSYIACIILSISMQTSPCDKHGDFFVFDKCILEKDARNGYLLNIFSTTVDVASDLMIMSLPVALLPKLQLDRKTKVGLGIAFCIGWAIIAVAIIRQSQVAVGSKVDMVGLAVWSVVETSTAVVVGSLPPLKAFITNGIRAFVATKASSKKYGRGGAAEGGGDGSNASRNVMVSESIPLDDMSRTRHGQVNGSVYVQKTFDLRHEGGSTSDGKTMSRGFDEEVAIAM